MTEKEAIKWLKEMQNPMISEAELYCAETCYGLGKMVYPEPEDYVFEAAIKALEEIQQYRAIGTIEEFKDLKEKSVAKKPRVYANGTRHCPNEDCEEVIYTSDEYCLKCGTKIDWSE